MIDVESLLRELVAIDSVNPGLVPGARGEGKIVTHVQQVLARAGWRTAVIEAQVPGRPSLIGWTAAPSGERRPVVLLNGHLDTVGVEGMDAPFSPKVDGDRLVGRGACDMKGGCAAIIAAALTLAQTCPQVAVVLALVADEEDRSLGSEAVIASLPALGFHPDVALVAEPTDLALASSLRGYAVVEASFTGRAAHSSQPEQGISAIRHLSRFLTEVEQAAAEVERGGGSLMVTVANAGSAPFSVPAQAWAAVERRTVPGERAEEALAEVQAILDRLRAQDSDVTATAQLTHARPAWQQADTGPSAALADHLATALVRRGYPRSTMAAPYWMESALYEDAGIPTVTCGPAGGGLHAVDEWVSLAQVRDFTEALVEAIAGWANAH